MYGSYDLFPRINFGQAPLSWAWRLEVLLFIGFHAQIPYRTLEVSKDWGKADDAVVSCGPGTADNP